MKDVKFRVRTDIFNIFTRGDMLTPKIGDLPDVHPDQKYGTKEMDESYDNLLSYKELKTMTDKFTMIVTQEIE